MDQLYKLLRFSSFSPFTQLPIGEISLRLSAFKTSLYDTSSFFIESKLGHQAKIKTTGDFLDLATFILRLNCLLFLSRYFLPQNIAFIFISIFLAAKYCFIGKEKYVLNKERKQLCELFPEYFLILRSE
jgi:hypothetical protein